MAAVEVEVIRAICSLDLFSIGDLKFLALVDDFAVWVIFDDDQE